MRAIMFCVVAVMATVAVSWLSLPTQAEQPNQVADFMAAKLTHSKNVLEGLATEDFDLIAKNAQDLALLSQAANWNVLQTEAYLQHSNEFRRSADAMKTAAAAKNLDGATLAYMQMTMNCVRCHKYVRSTDE